MRTGSRYASLAGSKSRFMKSAATISQLRVVQGPAVQAGELGQAENGEVGPPLLRPGRVASVSTVQSAVQQERRAVTRSPRGMWPGDELDYRCFALQHEGVHPGVLHALALRVDVPALITRHARHHGIQTLHRRLACMHTFLTEEVVPLRCPQPRGTWTRPAAGCNSCWGAGNGITDTGYAGPSP